MLHCYYYIYSVDYQKSLKPLQTFLFSFQYVNNNSHKTCCLAICSTASQGFFKLRPKSVVSPPLLLRSHNTFFPTPFYCLPRTRPYLLYSQGLKTAHLSCCLYQVIQCHPLHGDQTVKRPWIISEKCEIRCAGAHRASRWVELGWLPDINISSQPEILWMESPS